MERTKYGAAKDGLSSAPFVSMVQAAHPEIGLQECLLLMVGHFATEILFGGLLQRRSDAALGGRHHPNRLRKKNHMNCIFVCLAKEQFPCLKLRFKKSTSACRRESSSLVWRSLCWSSLDTS